ncbi:MAG: hypothetical protein ACPGJS_01815 [Flammeovirgaceae bacterium]
MKFWIYSEKELADLQSGFEKIFEVDNLYHDYENVWEWIESIDKKASYYLNIRRPHNWEHGVYDKPIIIKVETNDGTDIDEIKIALKIKSEFRCDVFAGEIFADSDDNPIIKEERKY